MYLDRCSSTVLLACGLLAGASGCSRPARNAEESVRTRRAAPAGAQSALPRTQFDSATAAQICAGADSGRGGRQGCELRWQGLRPEEARPRIP
jgi:hypothetical protein